MALSRTSFRERVTPAGLGRAILSVGGGAVAAGALFVWFATHGPVHSVEPAVGSLALGVAGVDRLFVVAYVGIGLTRLYLTALPLLFVGLGLTTALADRWWAIPAAVLLGAAAAGTLTVLTGCNCGSGSAEFLLQRVVRVVAGGTAPLVVGYPGPT